MTIRLVKIIPAILLLGLIIVAGLGLPAQASEGKFPTVWAEGTVEEVRQAIARGEPVNSEAASFTPLMAVASDTTNGLKKVKILLAAGADLNATGPGNSTALLEAITKNNYPVALLLLNVGAELYSTTDAGQTALITAITALPGLTSFKSDDTILQSQIEAWRLLMESRTKPNSVTVENNPPEGYTEIFGGNLVFKIPSYLDKEATEIGDSFYLYPDGQKPVWVNESMFSSPADGEAKFKSRHDSALGAPKIGSDYTLAGESITDQINQPGFLMTYLAEKNLEDRPFVPSHFSAYLKFVQGYLDFAFPIPCDRDAKDQVYDQDTISDCKNNLLASLKKFMPHYKWVGEERVTIGSNYRTRYGLISRDGLYLNPKLQIWLLYLVEDSHLSLDMTIGTYAWNRRDKSWLYHLLNNLKAHDGQEAKEFRFAFPRKVYGRWGMQLISLNDQGIYPATLTWTEFPAIGQGSHDPLFIEANFYKLPPSFEPQFDAQSAWELWNNFLDNIEVSP